MRAIVINEYGGPEQLIIEDLPEPEPEPGQVVIEVKAFGGSNRGYDLWLEVRQVEEARRNPNFFVYVVENIRQGDPSKFTLKILGGHRLQRLLLRAKEQRYYTVPWPVADYDLPFQG